MTHIKTARIRELWREAVPNSYSSYLGRQIFGLVLTVQGLLAFGMITLSVIVSKMYVARGVTIPLVFQELRRSGTRLIPMFGFMSVALGFAVIGQAVTQLTKYGATSLLLGDIMVLAVVRELGPLFTAMLVLARAGTANVVELGMSRSLGEVEALESVGVDPIHYFVAPRVIGMAIGVLSLTIYFIMGALLSGYLFVFLQNVPLPPADYFKQLADNLTVLDFLVLAVKALSFGVAIALITCYHGLAQPLRLEELSRVSISAVAQCIIACVLIDAVFVLVYLLI